MVQTSGQGGGGGGAKVSLVIVDLDTDHIVLERHLHCDDVTGCLFDWSQDSSFTPREKTLRKSTTL